MIRLNLTKNFKKNLPNFDLLFQSWYITKRYFVVFFSIIVLFFVSCSPKGSKVITDIHSEKDSVCDNTFADTLPVVSEPEIIVPADKRIDVYLPLLRGKNIALVANQTSIIDTVHLLDFLLSEGINTVKIFALEHGFRGDADRGVYFNSSIDEKTGIPIIAAYGKNRKPDASYFEDVDIVVFDIQDVGARFFTYLSSMHLFMEACAENGKKMIILDRPNPLGFYVDGPVLQEEFKSFVGMHPVPVVHGLTAGELALMINGEGWLKNGIQCDLEVIKVAGYKHSDRWHLPVKPSPNLPDDKAVLFYPSLCFFEATDVSIGRGTLFPFQVIGYPDKRFGEFSFVPKDIPGMQMNPVHEGETCYGVDLRNSEEEKFTLKYLIDFYNKFTDKSKFITKKRWFNLLAGNSELYRQIISGMPEDEIRKSWQKDLEEYKKMRKKYLLYLDFE
ncbi:MAG: DUF1343 domain-containing protein [Chlorobi bacterium]|nr:DUF1343 domain-containing protein [Chlorobiota bacterium]